VATPSGTEERTSFTDDGLLVTDFDGSCESLGDAGVPIEDTVEGLISRIFQLTDTAGNVITVAEVPPGA
jgi:hypothetical protein